MDRTFKIGRVFESLNIATGKRKGASNYSTVRVRSRNYQLEGDKAACMY